MQNKKFLIFIAISFLIISSTYLINAQDITTKANIQYPIEELGGCDRETNCKQYCDEPVNIEACLNFAEKNGLMAEEEIATAKKFIATDNSKKPGKCTTKNSCEEYCNDINKIDECLSFAIENNLMPPEELEEAKKVQAAIVRGVKPPACGNKKACDAYCDSSEHMEECINFAMEAGFMSEQEKADSQKMLAAVKKGAKPPKCKGKEECDAYCQQDEHFAECLNFTEAAGFMNQEEAKMARKTGGKGPGDCKGKEECEAFCNSPDNQETCFNFGKENGLIPEEDLKRMEQGQMPMQMQGPGGCNNPEECQQMQQQMEQQMQMQNQIQQQMPEGMQNPIPCQGENCSYGPPPSGTMPPQGQMPPQQYQQQPPTGEYPMPQGPMPPISGGEASGSTMPQFQQPAPGSAPSTGSGPAPGSEITPSPTSLNNPNLFMGFILYVFNPLFQPFLYGK